LTRARLGHVAEPHRRTERPRRSIPGRRIGTPWPARRWLPAALWTNTCCGPNVASERSTEAAGVQRSGNELPEWIEVRVRALSRIKISAAV